MSYFMSLQCGTKIVFVLKIELKLSSLLHSEIEQYLLFADKHAQTSLSYIHTNLKIFADFLQPTVFAKVMAKKCFIKKLRFYPWSVKTSLSCPCINMGSLFNI